VEGERRRGEERGECCLSVANTRSLSKSLGSGERSFGRRGAGKRSSREAADCFVCVCMYRVVIKQRFGNGVVVQKKTDVTAPLLMGSSRGKLLKKGKLGGLKWN